nr:HNH endonuclease signature motif containing protein [Comamonas kerstersii]
MCAAEGRVTVATVVDHIVPHRGDQSLFWRRSNWQSLCSTHHSKDKQRDERLLSAYV